MQTRQLRCPLCESSLKTQDNRAMCANNHSFDRAKEGYLNLLPVQFKGSKVPGDSKTMVLSRGRFLQQGFYQPLLDAIQQRANPYLQNATHASVGLDLGCGDGYYSAALRAADEIYGVDISKDAVKKAAKRMKSVQYLVASNFDVPMRSASCDVILCCFAPYKREEIIRLLNNTGALILITPAENHMLQVRQSIYRDVQTFTQAATQIEGLTLAQRERLSFDFELQTAEQVSDLIGMTPFAWKSNQEQIAKIGLPIKVEADFVISVWEKSEPALK